jgi:hypothetical protein
LKRFWIWIAAVVLFMLLVAPMPIAERFTSPTQDGQYLLNPVRFYGFVIAALRPSPSSRLGTSGAALASAKQQFASSGRRPTAVRLLFFPNGGTYSYVTRAGQLLTISDPPRFVWEVWGVPAGESQPGEKADVIALLGYDSGAVLARLPDLPLAHQP